MHACFIYLDQSQCSFHLPFHKLQHMANTHRYLKCIHMFFEGDKIYDIFQYDERQACVDEWKKGLLLLKQCIFALK